MVEKSSIRPIARIRPVALAAVALLALASCSKLGVGGSSAPSGQVVARLDGQEITTLEVNAELQGMQVPSSIDRHEAEKLALGNIITRRLLAGEATKRELDKRPEFLLQQRRTEDQLRVQALARDVASKVIPPTRDEAEKFMRENPAMFSERKVFDLDQIQFPRPATIADLGLQDAKTMAQVETILNAHNIPFRRQPSTLDTLGANPEFLKQVNDLLKRDPNELFMFSSQPRGAPGPIMLVNLVRQTRDQPFTGDQARTFASNFLRNQRIQNALKTEVDSLQKASADRVVFQKDWEVNLEQPLADAANRAAGASDGAATPAAPGAPGADEKGAPAAPATTATVPAAVPGGVDQLSVPTDAPAAK